MTRYFFMGWDRGRDRGDATEHLTLDLMPVFTAQNDLLDALLYSLSGMRIAPNSVRYFTPHGAVICRGRKIGYTMAVVKNDDPRPTWDTVAMQHATHWRRGLT